MKKTVIYIGGFELPDKNAAAHRVLNNAKVLSEIGYDTVFIDVNQSPRLDIDKKRAACGYDVYSIDMTSAVNKAKSVYSIKMLKSVYEKYKDTVVAVIAYNYPAIALNNIRRFCKSKNIKLFGDITEWYGKSGYKLFVKWIKDFDTYYRMNVLLKKTDGLITISRYLYEYYNKYTNCVQIPPLTDLSEEKWQKTNVQEDDILRIVYAGSPGRNKDKLNIILKALQNCKTEKVKFNIIGLTEKQYLTYYPGDAELVKKLSGVVSFKGRMAHLDVIDELKKSDFSLFYREITLVTTAGFPTKFAESISCGVPVITNRTSDLADYLEDGVNGYWIDDIQNDLKRILDKDISELKSIKKNIKRDTFDYHNYIDEMKQLF